MPAAIRLNWNNILTRRDFVRAPGLGITDPCESFALLYLNLRIFSQIESDVLSDYVNHIF